MKKVFSILAVAAMSTFIACGPSAEEKAKLEQRAQEMQDSIAASISESMQNEASADSTTESVPASTETDTTTAAPAAEGHGEHDGHNH